MEEIQLLKYFDGELTPDEVREVEAWASAAPENRALLEELYYTLSLGDKAVVMEEVDSKRALEGFKRERAHRERHSHHGVFGRSSRYVALAAAFAGGIILTLALLSGALNENRDYAVATPAGQRARFVLPDGSTAWLNSSTKLTYRTTFWSKERNIELNGEAYFEVVHNQKAPFVVRCGKVETQVLGTKFNVRARKKENRVVTTLLNGSVQVTVLGGGEHRYLLKPGESIDVDVLTNKACLTAPPAAHDVLLWINGRLTFEQQSFEKIALCLEKHFDVHFIFDDEKLKNEQFTCEFNTDDDIMDIISALAMTNYFKYRIVDKQVHLHY